MAGPLQGLKVVDLSRVLAGPLCARTLADLGAEVIKVEPPRPDVSRFSFPCTDGMSGYYAQQNVGKRNVSIDLNVRGARELVLKLCEDADIFVENFRAGTLKFFGLDYEEISKINPRLIYVSISGYGQAGPWASRMAYAPTVQAEIGFTHNTLRHYGDALARLRPDPLSHADVYAGLQATIAVLAAVHRREVTGHGQYIDVAMAAVMMAINERAHVDIAGIDTGAEPAILGATDGAFFVGPQGERFLTPASLVGSLTFTQYLRAMRRNDLGSDPRFATAALRAQNYDTLHAIVQTWMLTFRDMASLDAQLDESKIAIGEIRTMQDAAETEWAEYWGAVIDVPDRHGGTYRLHGRPWRFSSDELDAPSAPAFRGEHNADVFAELGMSMSEINALVEAGALVEHPHQRPSVESHVSPATLAADAAAGTVAACAQ
ncbi:CaiB/BaiF CoA transferase family protein [Burkholderia sp. IMCC1007]|uniref:CaiB/BaiF CoA transferase family protein n=1 Tax=Burkholderia sp. IMCC1007 TaxID=3004104 RepID=UPI0022B4CB32|nr:CaiB/BaiF CoA-transferase family protein [Burkholderia sp. IMCC1007]